MRLGLVVLAFLPAAAAAAGAQVSVYFDIQPGRSTKAEVDLNLGEPRARIEEGTYEYAPPRGVGDTSKVVVSYAPDTQQVVRIDVYLTTPLPAEALRAQFGTRIIERDRKGGGKEEIYYPKLHALVFSSKSPEAPVEAISYLSTRLMHGMYVERAREHLREKRYDEAMTAADKALVIDADYAGAYVAQGDILMARKNVDEAIVRYIAGTNARYTARSKGLANSRLGEVYWDEKKWREKAEAAHQEAIRIAPDLDEAHQEYGRFLRGQKRDDEALPRFLRALELNAENLRAQYAIADLYWDRKDCAKALPLLEALRPWAAAANDVDWSFKREVHHRYGYCQGEAGETEKSLAAFERILEQEPKNADAWFRLGVYAQKAGRFDEAVEHHRKSEGLRPDDFWNNRYLTRALSGAGRHEAAVQQAERNLSRKPDDGARMIEMARCYAVMGKKGKANDWLEKAVKAGYNNRQALVADPAFAALQDNRTFKSVVKRMP
jgi:tetratricopeptide (TPR) repeat protein